MKKIVWSILMGAAVLLVLNGCGGGGGGSDTTPRSVSGTVTGLTTGNSIGLQLNGGAVLTVNGDADGIVSFTFPDELDYGADYAVTIAAQPGFGNFWSVANASGTVGSANVTDVRVSGQLDDSFGTDGIVVSNAAAGYSGDDAAHGMVRYSNGKILVVGESEEASGDADMTIWRYDSDGTLDATFGDGGIVTDDYSHHNDAGYAITLEDPTDATSDILVTGVVTTGDHYQIMAVWRFDSNGDPVAGFGTGGIVVYSNPAFSSSNGSSVLFDANGGVLVAGSRTAGSISDLVIWQFLANGDPGLQSDIWGVMGLYAGGVGESYEGNSMVLVDPTSGISPILITGTAMLGSSITMGLWRFTAIGEPDVTFGGGDGVYYYNGSSGSSSSGYSLTLAVPADKASSNILVTGYFQNSSSDDDMAIWMVAANGSGLVSGFGTSGLVTSDNAAGGGGTDQGLFITLDIDDNVLVTGLSQNGTGGSDMVLWKCDLTGEPVSGFGWDGVLIDNLASGSEFITAGTSIAVVPVSGKIIVAGYHSNASENYDAVLWQFYP